MENRARMCNAAIRTLSVDNKSGELETLLPLCSLLIWYLTATEEALKSVLLIVLIVMLAVCTVLLQALYFFIETQVIPIKVDYTRVASCGPSSSNCFSSRLITRVLLLLTNARSYDLC